MKPLSIKVAVNATSEMIAGNLEATLKRGYRLIKENSSKGAVSVVGSGPSLADTHGDLAGDVLACNSAHDYLVSKGIKPKYAMLWDANPVMAQMITPQEGVTYLLASRCHPSVFEKMRGHDVVVWHALGDDELMPLLYKYKRDELIIAGGSSSVLRATHVAATMGYREEHLFGVDSCYSGNDTHITGSLVAQARMQMRCCGRWFNVAPWMVKQAEEFKAIAPLMKEHGIKVVVHGSGLVPYLATFLGCETPDVRVGWMEKRLRPLHSLHALYELLRHSPTTLEPSHAGI